MLSEGQRALGPVETVFGKVLVLPPLSLGLIAAAAIRVSHVPLEFEHELDEVVVVGGGLVLDHAEGLGFDIGVQFFDALLFLQVLDLSR